MRALVTGGAGLIGSHIVDHLLSRGYKVNIIDNLEPETHPKGKPSWVPEEVSFFYGDVADEKVVFRAMKDVNIIFHQAAYGGFTVNQNKYVNSNTLGTSNIFQVIKIKKLPIEKIVLASSQAVYGEGRYKCELHGIKEPAYRPIEQLRKREWELKCPECGREMTPLAVDENKRISPSTMYAITKYTEELIGFIMGKSLNIPVVCLRYSVTYGPRQSLFNPYTGICSIFSTRILNNLPPVIYEDGLQTRDFIFVEDVARANLFVMDNEKANFNVYNVGSGKQTTVIDFVKVLSEAYGKEAKYQLTGEFRPGDVRHLFSNNSKLSSLGFTPTTSLKKGIKEYAEWILEQGPVEEFFSKYKKRMEEMGIVRKSN